MTDIALMRALIAFGEAVRKRSNRVTGRRAMSMYCLLRARILRGPEANRHARRAAGQRSDFALEMKALRMKEIPDVGEEQGREAFAADWRKSRNEAKRKRKERRGAR